MSASLLFSCREATKERLPYYNTPDFNPLFISNANELNTKVRHHIADFSFTDQHNQTITQADVEGKIHVADFFFTSCGSICPVMTDHMKIIDSAYRDDPDVALLSYSVTPWIDRVAVLDSYAKRNQITNKNWHLLTGSKAEIYQLARQSYFAEEDLGFTKDSTNFLHTEHFILIDRNKRIRGIYNGTLELEIRQLVKDIATLKDEE
ncbi:MAG: SCO family protein [Pedobacter sp.]|nr:SCO family protein [Pedobacter sp.]MDQ8053784.1 SCO family protein [Pedobacter sp.]